MVTFNLFKYDDETIAIEQCTPDKWCTALNSFLEHINKKDRVFTITGTHLASREDLANNREGKLYLIYRMSRELGNFAKLFYCPFCGGQVSPLMSITADGKLLEKHKYIPVDEFDKTWKEIKARREKEHAKS